MSNNNWKTHYGNERNRKIRASFINYDDGIWGENTEQNNKKYYKAIGAPSVLGIGTDNPYSRLSFGNSADIGTNNIEYNRPTIALYEKSSDGNGVCDGTDGVGFQYINDICSNNLLRPCIGVFVGMDDTSSKEIKYFDDSTKATCYITKDKMFLNKQINDDAYNNDITLDIGGGVRCNNVILGYSDVEISGNMIFNEGIKKLQIYYNGIWNDIKDISATAIPITETDNGYFYIKPKDVNNNLYIGNKTTGVFYKNRLNVDGNIISGDSDWMNGKTILNSKDISGNISLKGFIGLGERYNLDTIIDISNVNAGLLRTTNSQCKGLYSVAIGESINIRENAQLSMVMGKFSDISNGSYNLSFGVNNNIDGSYNLIVGGDGSDGSDGNDGNTVGASGSSQGREYNTLLGTSNKSGSNYNLVVGSSNKLHWNVSESEPYDLSENNITDYNVIFGSNNTARNINNSFIVGEGNQKIINSIYDNSYNSIYCLGNDNTIGDISHNYDGFIIGNNCDISNNLHFVLGASGNAISIDIDNNVEVFKKLTVYDISVNHHINAVDISCSHLEITKSTIHDISSNNHISAVDVSCSSIAVTGLISANTLNVVDISSSNHIDALDVSCSSIAVTGTISANTLNVVDISSSNHINALDVSCNKIQTGNIILDHSSNFISTANSNVPIPSDVSIFDISCSAGIDISLNLAGITEKGKLIYIFNQNVASTPRVDISCNTYVTDISFNTLSGYICTGNPLDWRKIS